LTFRVDPLGPIWHGSGNPRPCNVRIPPEGKKEEDAMADKRVDDRELEEVNGGAVDVAFLERQDQDELDKPPQEPPTQPPEPPDDVDGGGGPSHIEPLP
jgi:hypothetical protein